MVEASSEGEWGKRACFQHDYSQSTNAENILIQVLALPFKKGTKRADKANAVELYVSLTEGDELDEVDAIEKEAFDKLMDGAF